MEFHEIANIFPLMDGPEFTALVEDIRTNGLLDPIITHDGKIIDGRNRYRACVEAGVAPRFEVWRQTTQPMLDWVVSKNLHRRHLSPTQASMVGGRIANLKNGTNRFTIGMQNCTPITRDDAAKLVNVSRRSIQDATKILQSGNDELILACDADLIPVSQAAIILEMPEHAQSEIIGKVSAGASPAQAVREVKHAEKRSRALPDGKYSVVYADPPWQYSNSGFDSSAENHYPTMPVDEICNIPIQPMTTDTTVLFLWATNPLLPDAMKVIRAWGFEYKTNIVWIKSTTIGMGWFLKSKHELLLIATKSNTPHPQMKPESCFETEKISIHSRKPEIAYEIIESMYPGKKIELFARISRDGWDSWGNEEI